MITFSFPFLVGCSLAVTGALVCLNSRGAGIASAAAMTLLVSVSISFVPTVVSEPAQAARRMAVSWVLFVLGPSAVVFVISRMGGVQARWWLLTLVGPLAFVVAMVVTMVVYNVLFSSSRLH